MSSYYVGSRNVQDLRHGYGKYMFSTGEIYVGHWVSDLQEGLGEMYYPSGSWYKGSFKNDLRDGKGTYHWSDGKKYDGEWLRGNQHGKGLMQYPSGDRYEGNWYNANRNGLGYYVWGDLRTFEGNWVDGKQNGQGIMTYPSGASYVGSWKDSLRGGGIGVYTWPEGHTYSGGWENNNRHGYGIYKKTDGAISEGIWHDGLERDVIHTDIDAKVNEEKPGDSVFDLIGKYDFNGIRQRLTKHQNEIKLRLPSGHSVLHHAVQVCPSAHMEILTLLIAIAGINEVDIFCEDNQGRNPLHTACFLGKFPHAQYLLTVYGVDTAFEIDKNGCTPLQLQQYHKISLELFLNELKGNLQLHVAAKNEVHLLSSSLKSGIIEFSTSEMEQQELLRVQLRGEIDADERRYMEAFKQREVAKIPIHLINRWSNNFQQESKISDTLFYKGILHVNGDVQAVAIKVLTDVARYQNELTVLSANQHPNIIHTLGHSDSVQPTVYIVFPYAANRGLDAMLRSDASAKLLVCAQRVTLASKVAGVFNYLHTNNTCHGDFNTKNIVMTTELTPKLINFGASTQLTVSGCVKEVQDFAKFLSELIFHKDDVEGIGEVESGTEWTEDEDSNVVKLVGEYFVVTNDAPDTPDYRAGVWAAGCVGELSDLIARCMSDATLTFSTVVQIMDGINSRYGLASNSSEERLLSMLSECNSRTEASNLKDEINRRKMMCSICWLEYPLRDGVMCRAIDPLKAHYRCNDCLSNTVLNQAAISYRHSFGDNSCRIICEICNNSNCYYTDAQLALHASEDAFTKYKDAITEVEVEKVSALYNRRITKLQKAIMLTTSREKLLENHYLHVTDKILTLHCPSCNAAVLDFDGCFAVKCNCNSYFCGWCLTGFKDSHECHSHVKGCPQSRNQNDYYGSPELFQAHHNERRSKELGEYIMSKIPLEDQGKFKALLHEHVSGLELTIEE